MEPTPRASGACRRARVAAVLLAACAVSAASWADKTAADRSANLDLERAVEGRVKELRREGRLRGDERTAWVMYDLTSGRTLASINEDQPFEAASLIKPFLALAYFHQVKAGKLRYGPREQARMEAMIQRSDNAAADWCMRQVGGPARAQRLLKAHYGGLLRDLRLVEYIPVSGRTYRNKASAHDYSRFLYAVWTNAVPYSAELRRLLHLPKRDRLFSDTQKLPDDTEVYDKTGTTSRLIGDMGVLVVKGPGGKNYPYIIVGLIQKNRRARRYVSWMRSRGDVIRGISDLAYEIVSQMHGFGQPRLSDAKAP